MKQENEKAKTADNLQKELDDLRSRPTTDTTPTAEQQQKIDNLIELIEKQNELIRKYGNGLASYTRDYSFRNEIIDTSKLNK